MRINSGSAGSAGDTKTYDAESLIAAANARAKHYQTLRSQFHTLRAAFNQIANLGVDFQGKGADAIKKFYAAQVNVVDAWLRMIDKQIAYYHGVAGTIDDKNLGGDTQVQVPFLDEDLSRGYARSKEMVREQRDDIAKILSDISDLVPINVFSNHDVDQALDAAEQKRAKMVLDVQDLDQNLTNEYRQVTDDLPYIASLYGELINATGQGADVQPMHFNAHAYHDSKIYQVQDEMAKETQKYLKSKKQQEKARQVSKKDTQPLNPLLENAAKGIILKKEIQDGVQEGAKDTIKDTIIGLWDAVTSPRQTLEGTWFAATHLRETFDTVKHALIQSYEKDMVHGNAYTRSRWVTYALGTVALSFVGTKGIDKVGKMAKLGRIGEAASKARVLTKTTLVKHTDSITNKLSEWNTALFPKMQFADGDVPFNVVDSKGLKNKLLNIPDSTPHFTSQIDRARNFIQQASAKKIDGLNERKETSVQKASRTEIFINSISDLKHTDSFRTGALEHILEGELNARGKAVGYHSESIEKSIGKIIKGTESTPNKFGIYKAKVEVNGVPKTSNGGTSTFFPKNWDAQKVIDSINIAFDNKVLIKGNTYSGKLKNGMEISMYIDKNGKIISAFPVY
ncbi:MAG: hypothetical protein K0Q56_257 [Sporolactobacillus laevolacticus]|jgi:predicted ribonuclease toxin of YeeF-YezG toxin-antitoxin module|nr:hypothetical protein [Sporolactobacillus laevolacticus]